MCAQGDDPSMHDAPERDPALVIEAVLTPPEKRAFMAGFLRLNRGWRGAQVADALDGLSGVDSDLDLVEPIIVAHPEADPRLLGTAVRAAVYSLLDTRERANVETLALVFLRRVAP